jgi:hypothetical protein
MDFFGRTKDKGTFPAVAAVREILAFNGIERGLRVPNVKAGHTLPLKAF